MQAQIDTPELLLYAVRGEKASFAVYTAAAARARVPRVATLLGQLARDEMGHLFALLQRYARQYPEILNAVDIAVPVPEATAVDQLGQAPSVRVVLRAAVDAERESLAAYAQLSGAVTGAARPVLQTIMRRERRHVALLERLLADANAARRAIDEGRRAH